MRPARSESLARMSLEFADFAYCHAAFGVTEDEQRANFEVYASILESIAQLFWHEEPGQNPLGISFDLDTMPPDDKVESDGSLKSMFNCAACPRPARKKES